MIADLPNLRVYYEDEGSGEPVVLLHSLGTDERMWGPIVPPLLADGWRVIRPDLRGHGRSGQPPGPYHLDDFADDLAAFARAIGVDAFHLVGLSLGGMVGQAFALRHPEMVRSLVLADTTSHYPPAGRAIMEERAERVGAEGMAAVASETVARWFTPEFAAAHPDVVAQYQTGVEEMDPAGYAAAGRAVAAVAYRDRLGEIGAPALVIVGTEDQATPPEQAEELAAGIRGAEIERIPGAHLSPVEAPEAFSEAVLRFLRMVARGRPA